MPQPGDGADLPQEAVEHAGLLDDVLADDLEDFVAGHQAVVGEVDDAHAADAQLADDLVVGVVGQLGRWGAGRRTGRGTGARWPDGLGLVRRGGCCQGR